MAPRRERQRSCFPRTSLEAQLEAIHGSKRSDGESDFEGKQIAWSSTKKFARTCAEPHVVPKQNECFCSRATICFPERNTRFNEHCCFSMYARTTNEPANNKRNDMNISYYGAKPPSHRGDLKLSIRFVSSEAACHKQDIGCINQKKVSQAKRRFV